MSRPHAPAPIKLTLLKNLSIGVVGLGQIGGSIVRRLTVYRPEITVYGMDVNTRIAGRVRRYCRWSTTLEDMVRAVDMIILSVPVPAIIEYLPRIAAAVRDSGFRRLLVTDTGTLKFSIQKAAQRFIESFDYVGIHPLCGTERNGWDSARTDLFAGETLICCGNSNDSKTRVISELIRALGGTELRLDAKEHDRQIALTIGLPHVLAFVANATAQQMNPDPQLVSGSWQSMVRVTRSDPGMVAGFLSANKVEQRRVVNEFRKQLDRFEEQLEQRNAQALSAVLAPWQTPFRST